MLALVIFNDGIYHICKSKDVTKHGNECVAKYKNVKYTCRIIAQHSKYVCVCLYVCVGEYCIYIYIIALIYNTYIYMYININMGYILYIISNDVY